MWRCAMDINPSEGCAPFSLKSEITWARKWWLRIGQIGIYSLKSDCFSLPPHFMQSDCQPLWILFSKIFPGSKVWVWSQPNGAVKKDRYWMPQLYTRCVLYSKGKIPATKITLHGMNARIWRCAGHLWRVVTYYCNTCSPCYIILLLVAVLLKHRFVICTVSFN
jgi:hypothetical protein